MQRDPVITDRARQLRRDLTPAESKLWAYLRNRQFADTKFVKQATIDRFVVDFAARACKLAIEIDGDTHVDAERDARRSERIATLGYRMIRFSNADVMTNIGGVLDAIGVALAAAPPPTPSPTGRGL